MNTLKLVLYDEVVPSKKNSKITIWSKKYHRGFVIPSNKYQAWESKNKKIVEIWALEMRNKYGIQFPLTKAGCKILFYWNNNRRLDNTNKAESIHDLLVLAGVLSDDRWQILNPTSQESKKCITMPRTEIYLSKFS